MLIYNTHTVQFIWNYDNQCLGYTSSNLSKKNIYEKKYTRNNVRIKHDEVSTKNYCMLSLSCQWHSKDDDEQWETIGYVAIQSNCLCTLYTLGR